MLAPTPQIPPTDSGGLPPIGSPPPPPKWHDVKIRKKTECEKACVQGVPPEEFGIASRARNIRDAGYCYHAVPRMVGDLIDEGFDAKEVKLLPAFRPWVKAEEIARDTVNESSQTTQVNTTEMSRMVQIFEHYIEMDYDGDGLCVYKVTTGIDNKPLKRKGYDTVEKMDGGMPFAAITPVIMTHRFWGRSIADLVMDVQRIKTVLIRGLLDNLYLRNNFRTEVPESHATRNTIDDLINPRPGGVVRTKQPGGLSPLTVEDVSQSIYPALQYFDATREWRTGLSRQGQGVDPNALQNQVATIANQMEAMSDKKIKLIARIFADTGIRDLFQLLHATIRKYGSKAQTVRLRNQWVSVDPREWRSREDMTIKVALGSGNKAQQLAGQQLIIQAQTQGIAAGLVSKENLWNSAQELCRITGHPDAGRFFVDPMAPVDPNNPAATPIPPPQDPKQQAIQQQAQTEQAKIQADAAHQKMRTEQEAAIEQIKLQHQAAIENMRAQNDQQLALLRAQIEREKINADIHKEQIRAQVDVHKEEMRAKPQATVEVKHGAEQLTGPIGEAISTLGQHLANSHQSMMESHRQHMDQQNQMLNALALHITAPKRVVRGKDGKVSHVETVVH